MIMIIMTSKDITDKDIRRLSRNKSGLIVCPDTSRCVYIRSADLLDPSKCNMWITKRVKSISEIVL